VNAFEALWPAPVTPTVKVNVPGAEGVPLREPPELSVIPPGSAPVEIDQASEPLPPAAASVWL